MTVLNGVQGPFAQGRIRWPGILAALVLAALLLAGCGGGGGSGGGAPDPQLSVSPASISLEQTLGSDPASASFSVRNSGGGTLSFQATASGDALTLSQSSGRATAGASVSVSVESACESPGDFSGSIEVSGAGSSAQVSVSVECVRPPVSVEIAESPASSEGWPGQDAEGSLRWSISSPWSGQPALSWSISTDRDDVTLQPAEGSARLDEAVEIALMVSCPDQSLFDAGLTLAVDEQETETTWPVRCRAGDARFLLLELHQGPMQWRQDFVNDETITAVPAVEGRRTAAVARVGHDSPTVPGLSATIRNASGEALEESPVVLLTDTSNPRDGEWETEYVFDAESHYQSGNRVDFVIDPDGTLDETNEDNNSRQVHFDDGEPLPNFRITFVPIHVDYGNPSEIDTEDYMDRINDYLPVAQYEAEVGRPLEFLDRAWDAHEANVALTRRWNAEADPDEFYHGLFRYPYDGSTCGYAWYYTPVAVSASWDGGCNEDIQAHELGHNFSLRHAPGDCGEANVDTNYPYPGAGMGPHRGWLFSEGKFVNQEDGYRDVMSYCQPTFVSDYNYKILVAYLRSEVSIWPNDRAAQGPIASSGGGRPGPVAQSGPGGGEQSAGPGAAEQSRPSLALTGAVDEYGAWSLLHIDASPKPPRQPPRQPPAGTGFVLILQDSAGKEIYRQPLMVAAASHGSGKIWAARIPWPKQAPKLLVILNDEGAALLVEQIQLPNPDAKSSVP